MADEGVLATTERSSVDVPRSIFDALPAGVVVQAPDGRIVDANAAACRILGMSWDQMLGRTSVDPRWRAVHEDESDYPGAEHPAMRVLASGEPVGDEVMGVHKPNGELTRILINAEPLPAADGTLSVVTSFTDITDQVRLRQRLAESEHLYRLLAENSADVVVRTEDNVITWVSPSVAQALGWEPADWIGHDRIEFVHPDDVEPINQISPGIVPGVPLRSRRRFRDKDGGYHWVELQVRVDPDRAEDEPMRKTIALRVIDAEVLAREVEHRATHDELTGLLNRAETLDRLTAALAGAADRGWSTGVVFCDVDDFKDVNDGYGHRAGDDVLRAVAQRLTERLRRGDVVGRIGGDELLVVLENVGDAATARKLAEQLLAAASIPVTVAGIEIGVTMSAGVTIASPVDSVDDAVARADRAMFEAKRSGKSCVVLAPSSPRP